MIKSYFNIAWRNLVKNRKSSFINILGLAMGMAVFILIALWIWNVQTYDRYHRNHDRIGQIWQTQVFNGEAITGPAVPLPLENELKTNYGNHLEHVVMASWVGSHVLSQEDKHLSHSGIYMDTDGPRMLTLDIQSGSIDGLDAPNSIMLAESTAKAFFGDDDPIGQVMKIDQALDVQVTAVYKDLPYNTTFRDLKFIAPWSLYLSSESWFKRAATDWADNSFQCFVELSDDVSFERANAAVQDAKLKKVSPEEQTRFQAKLIIHPMNDWYLYSTWKNGVAVGGVIEYVNLFAIIGLFVLALACINFMNLSTARSERRAKEVGIRKTVGSPKRLLVAQFLSESTLIAIVAFVFSLLLVFIALPWFNEVTDTQLAIPWTNGIFWGAGLVFTVLTGLIAGSYPAFYLSSFNPLRVLKGTFKAGRLASLPRKMLVVVQFTISLALIIGTLIVFRQIQHSKNRPAGYNRERLVMVEMATPDFYGKFDVLQHALKEKNLIVEMAESSSPLTAVWSNSSGFEWQGKDPNLTTDFGVVKVTHDYGKTISWQLESGRDFSRDHSTDSAGFILNQAAVQFMGIDEPVGKTVRWGNRDYRIIGTVHDVVMSSPFQPVKPTVYLLDYENVNWMIFQLNPRLSTATALADMEETFRKVIPNAPFAYQFADAEYAAKFALEERIGKAATLFAIFAIVISCLGVFGLASFVAEQRTKEIGIRKVVGASVFQLWRLLSTDFLILVLIACFVASPVAYYALDNWLQQYAYRTSIPWWIFGFAIAGALVLTLLVVSFQTFKAARLNPVDSLRDE